MSVKASSWAWSLKSVSGHELLVLLALADAANDDGYCWPSQAEIACKARQVDRTVRRHLTSLTQKGLIQVETRMRRGWGNGRSSNGYYLNLGMTDADVVAGQTQPDNLSACEVEPETPPVDNLHNRRSDTTGQSVLLSPQQDTGVRSQQDTGDRLYPYGSFNHHDEPPNQTMVPAQPSDAAGALGVVRSGLVGTSNLKDAMLLVRKCLPDPMHIIDAQLAPSVGQMLQERLDAGWSPAQIRAAMDQPLPAQVSRLGSLVAKRLATNVLPELAPEALRKEALGRVATIQPVDDEPLVDPRFNAVCERIRHENPEFSQRKVAELAYAQIQQSSGALP
ncbi:helix-turn-helix domain-containing protein [Jonesiaceae bacterium BS-20]|uniref:Helix-turn-helix domain-containing protein n=1 Tax=Jonesiaceae bacterium BS-20 TaxID=3120821 RepID=A0AAU7DXF5_9MICO